MIRKILLPGSEGELPGYSCFSVSALSMRTAVGDASKVSFDDTEGENSSAREGDLGHYREHPTRTSFNYIRTTPSFPKHHYFDKTFCNIKMPKMKVLRSQVLTNSSSSPWPKS